MLSEKQKPSIAIPAYKEHRNFLARSLACDDVEESKKWLELHRSEVAHKAKHRLIFVWFLSSITICLLGAFGVCTFSRYEILSRSPNISVLSEDVSFEIDDQLMKIGLIGLGAILAILSPDLLPMLLKVANFKVSFVSEKESNND